MKTFFHFFLYLNVGVGSLFFVIWLFTSVPFFQVPAFAEEPSSPAIGNQKNTSPLSGPSDVSPQVNPPNDQTAPSAGVETKEGVDTTEGVETKEGVGVSESKVENNTENKVAPDPPAVITDGSGPSVDGETPVQRKGASVEEPPIPPPPPVPSANEDTLSSADKKAQGSKGGSEPIPSGNISSDLSDLIESAKEFQENKKEGVGASIAQDLMQINKKVANIYQMLGNYNYDPNDRRDPFIPFQMQKEEDVEEDTREVIPSYPTGKYKISEIKLVGIKWNSTLGPAKALFRTPDNIIHPLQKNDRIGINRGVIYQLREDEVVILEPKAGIISDAEDAYIPIIVRLHRWSDQDGNQKLNQQQQFQPSEG